MFVVSQRYYSRSAGDQSSPFVDGLDSLENYKLMVYSAQSRLSEAKCMSVNCEFCRTDFCL